MHRLSTVAYDGHSHWWVCTCGAYGPTEDSRRAAASTYQRHVKERS